MPCTTGRSKPAARATSTSRCERVVVSRGGGEEREVDGRDRPAVERKPGRRVVAAHAAVASLRIRIVCRLVATGSPSPPVVGVDDDEGQGPVLLVVDVGDAPGDLDLVADVKRRQEFERLAGVERAAHRRADQLEHPGAAEMLVLQRLEEGGRHGAARVAGGAGGLRRPDRRRPSRRWPGRTA